MIILIINKTGSGPEHRLLDSRPQIKVKDHQAGIGVIYIQLVGSPTVVDFDDRNFRYK